MPSLENLGQAKASGCCGQDVVTVYRPCLEVKVDQHRVLLQLSKAAFTSGGSARRPQHGCLVCKQAYHLVC